MPTTPSHRLILDAEVVAQIREVAQRHGVSRIRVFGSVARGDAQPESDLDLLVDMAPDRSLLDLVGFQQEVEDRIARRVDVGTERTLHPLIRDRVLAEAVPL